MHSQNVLIEHRQYTNDFLPSCLRNPGSPTPPTDRPTPKTKPTAPRYTQTRNNRIYSLTALVVKMPVNSRRYHYDAIDSSCCCVLRYEPEILPPRNISPHIQQRSPFFNALTISTSQSPALTLPSHQTADQLPPSVDSTISNVYRQAGTWRPSSSVRCWKEHWRCHLLMVRPGHAWIYRHNQHLLVRASRFLGGGRSSTDEGLNCSDWIGWIVSDLIRLH